MLLLSVKKLMARNVPIVEPSFECLSDRMLQGAILCIDEFDASRQVILDCLIEKSLSLRADYLQLFNQVYQGIRMHQASRELTVLRSTSYGRNQTWQALLDGRLTHKDVDAVYLGDVTHVSVNLWDADNWKSADLMEYCFQMECLYQNDEISCNTMQNLLRNGIGCFSGKRNVDAQAQARLRQCSSFYGKVTRDVVQAVGRMGRTFLKRPNVYLFTTTKVLQCLDADCLEGKLLAPEMQAIVRAKRAMQAGYPRADRVHLEAERVATRGNAYLMRMLNVPWNASMALWKELRQMVLRSPRASETLYRESAAIRTFYLPLSPEQPRYFFAQKGDFSEVQLALESNRSAFAATLPQGVFSSEVSAEEARLPILLRYPGLRDYFEEQGWAVDFEKEPYILSPVLFQNIYKGALGEVAGSFILQKELGLALQEIDDPACFEFFDFVGPNGIWVDFKHWKSSTRQPEEIVRQKTLAKLDAVSGQRAFW